ncbi:transcriptional regulator family: Fungal Specific TF [Penicillium chermesinum]|nr:transcriptional regulator family: Fungal Specific TF [Penicillium chermesinum]
MYIIPCGLQHFLLPIALRFYLPLNVRLPPHRHPCPTHLCLAQASPASDRKNRRGHASGKRPLRLPIIAPKEEVAGKSEKSLVAPPRIRLPPRSRTGCWTCRSRKVKCDEGHPQCNQCTRLGHVCDYRPRLAFRDDTPRIMGRMSDVKTAGNIVWDLSSPTPSEDSRSDYFSSRDSLPPFSLLTSDEDREKKAEASAPGTFHVVVVPDSFATLPEYSDDTDKLSLHEIPEYNPTANSPTTSRAGSDVEHDPNVVILKTFEDVSRRSPSSKSRVSPTSEISDPFCALSLSPSLDPLPSPAIAEEDLAQFLEFPVQPSQDFTLFSHFRHVVWKQLFPHDRQQDASYGYESSGMSLNVDFIEREAARFPPLSHAIMVVSALSLAHSGTGHNVDALQYYQQAFPPSKIVAAAEPHGSNLWSHHISRLLHISFLRKAHFGREPHPFIIWWVCHIDLYALFSGAGNGEFVRSIMDNQMLPGYECLCYPSNAEGFSVIYPKEADSLPVMMHLYAETFKLAAQLGFLGAQLRQERRSMSYADFNQRSKEIGDLRQAFSRLWESPDVAFWQQHQDNLPRRSQEIMQQLRSSTCNLFSYTSMWPGQRLESEYSTSGEIDHHASEILRIAERTNSTRRADRHFLVFPLFLAGATVSASGLKMMAMELMTGMEDEEDGMGRNAATTRAILQTVYERQLERLMRVGHTLDVEWADLMAQERLQMVNFGF